MTNQVTHHLTNQLTSHVTNHQLHNDEPGDSPVPPPDLSDQLEIAKLRERAKSAEERAQTLEGLADYHKQLLTDSEWRFQEILQQLKQSQQNVAALTRALPAPTAEAPREDPDATTMIVDPEPKPTRTPTPALVAVRESINLNPEPRAFSEPLRLGCSIIDNTPRNVHHLAKLDRRVSNNPRLGQPKWVRTSGLGRTGW